jgi:hypothetical protein
MGNLLDWEMEKDRQRAGRRLASLAETLEQAELDEAEDGEGVEVVWRGCRIGLDYMRSRQPRMLVFLDRAGESVTGECDTLDEVERFVRREVDALTSG